MKGREGTWVPPAISNLLIHMINSLCHRTGEMRNDAGTFHLTGWEAESGGNPVRCPGAPTASRSHQGTLRSPPGFPLVPPEEQSLALALEISRDLQAKVLGRWFELKY